MFENLDLFIKSSSDVTDEELSILHSLMEVKTFPKKTYLLQEGDICNFEAYVNKGCIRNYYINENGFETILQFAVEGWWVSDIASFHDRTPSKLFIETLEDSELFTLSYDNKEELLRRVPKFERLFRILIQRNLSSTQNRLITTISKTASEKYLDFISLYPTISQRVAQHYIASYLGISAEFLSKIRTKLSKQ